MNSALLATRSGERMARTSASRIDAGEPETALALVGGPELLRAAIGDLIDAQPGMRFARSVSSIEALAERQHEPDCAVVLLDADAYRGCCVLAIDRLLALGLDCKLVLLCSETTPEIVLCAGTRRIDGVAHILTGHAVMPARWRAVPETVALTPRQIEVLTLIARGYSNDEIAEYLDVRPNTVKFHISEIFRRLGVRNRIEAIARLAERHGE